MRIDVLLETFGARWSKILAGAVAAERVGLDGVWLNDHLAGSVQGAPDVLECWTILSALAADVPRITVGPLVLNVGNRDPGTLGVMAATLQHVSGGRLILGLGAGARAGTSYAIEQDAFGPSRACRSGTASNSRAHDHGLASGLVGSVPPAEGFLRPEPAPPIVVAAFGPKMAELAGRVGDGICVPAGSKLAELVAVARRARVQSGRDPEQFLVTVSLVSVPQRAQSWVELGVDRLIVYVAPPFEEGVERLAEIRH